MDTKVVVVPNDWYTTAPIQTLDSSPKSEAQRRKEAPMYSGLLAYFPDALEEVARVSFVCNQQHNPGEPLHWARDKSTDEPDALIRHMKDRAKGQRFDSDGVRHLAKAAWRALANLQKEIEADGANSR